MSAQQLNVSAMNVWQTLSLFRDSVIDSGELPKVYTAHIERTLAHIDVVKEALAVELERRDAEG